MASPPVQRAEVRASRGAKRSAPRRSPAGPLTARSAEPSLREVGAVGGPASKRVLRSQGRRTMRRLLDAAMIAFDQRGYYDTRINDVVKIAKTSHGTFYLYFSNKEDLLRALVTEAGAHARHLAGALDWPPESGATPQWSHVRGWIALYSDLWIRYAPLFRAWTDLATIDRSLLEILRQTLTLMSDALERQIEQGVPDPSIDPHTAGMAVMAMLDRFHYMREFVGQPVDEIALDTLATMIHRSLFERIE